MGIVFMNSGNSKRSDSHRLQLDLTKKNINKSYKCNKFKIPAQCGM